MTLDYGEMGKITLYHKGTDSRTCRLDSVFAVQI